MTRRRCLAAAVVLVALLGGCGADDVEQPSGPTEDTAALTGRPSTEATPESPPEATAAPSPEAAPTGSVTSDRGHLVTELGEPAVLVGGDGQTPAVELRLQEIVRGPACDSGVANPPRNGMHLGLRFDVLTHPDLGMHAFELNPYDLRAFRADGSRVDEAFGDGSDCLSDDTRLPSDIGPGQTASGWIVLDVPADVTVVAYVPFWAETGTGWEWQVPSA